MHVICTIRCHQLSPPRTAHVLRVSSPRSGCSICDDSPSLPTLIFTKQAHPCCGMHFIGMRSFAAAKRKFCFGSFLDGHSLHLSIIFHPTTSAKRAELTGRNARPIDVFAAHKDVSPCSGRTAHQTHSEQEEAEISSTSAPSAIEPPYVNTLRPVDVCAFHFHVRQAFGKGVTLLD
ncbi:hypothetical protein ZHAS_00012993 [Anopheles sinensis]|uniref:Uncharacterized protein n=1 Tax=Anopheles sinensis TaxID=74873 RepID=A0A084W4A6_ANOSI|nr:hypothetical protein ZHAS_00012993 [Anopheles sinensis]